MLNRYLILITIMSIFSVERNWGRSLESMRYMQMVDPEAGKNLDPVEGLDGNASENTVNKYQKSFKETKQKESTTILKLQ
jgi:hypothetical protein